MSAHLQAIEDLAYRLMKSYGLTEKGWRFRWDNSRRRAGQCRYTYREIGLSKPLMSIWTVDRAEETIRHEIAHALTPGSHHGWEWQRKCLELGIKPERCYSVNDETQIATTYIGRCPNGHVTGMMRLPKREKSCSQCSRRFDPRYLFTWTLRAPSVTPVAGPATTKASVTTAAQTEETPKQSRAGKAPRCHAPMPGGRICNRVQGHTRGHDAR